MAGRRSRKDPARVRLQPADAFDLIRWLARSQSDPRKAVAELVQNAIDAGARTITLERRRRGRRASLMVRDDGEGIRPTEEREAALRYLATHIGRSHKRNLSPAERHQQIVAGQYGIGLLGFWSIGHRMEIRSRVGAGAVWLLRLVEDEPRAEVVPGPPSIDAAPTFTELVITELHPAALRPLAARRLAEYLGSELRGPLLASGAAVEVREYDTRGQLAERAPVTPRRFDGVRLDVPAGVAVPGLATLQVELYLAGATGAGGAVELTCAGTVVADRLADLAGLDLDHPPWNDPALTGTIEFPALSIPPGSRRGVTPDASAAAMVQALAQLAPLVQAALDRHASERSLTSERQLVNDLRRALRGLRARLPHLELPSTLAGRGGAGEHGAADPLADSAPGPGALVPDDDDRAGAAPGDDAATTVAAPADEPLPPRLLPPGPAHHVRLSPDPVRLWPGGARGVRALVHDVHGQRIDAALTWLPSSPLLELDDGGAPARMSRVARLADAAADRRYQLTVIAEAGGGSTSTTVDVEVADGPPAGAPGAGIPEPVLVEDGGSWRSRMLGATWQVNIAHPDYRALAVEPRARLRYLVALFAKDLTVARGHPGHEPIIEQVLEIIALGERNLLRTPR